VACQQRVSATDWPSAAIHLQQTYSMTATATAVISYYIATDGHLHLFNAGLAIACYQVQNRQACSIRAGTAMSTIGQATK